MTRQAGVNWLLVLFVVCALTLLAVPGVLGVLLSLVGIAAAIVAWRRKLIGFVGVLSVCSLAALVSAYGAALGLTRATGFAAWLQPSLFAALALALATTRREFYSRGRTDPK